jgi:hypothetical protein
MKDPFVSYYDLSDEDRNTLFNLLDNLKTFKWSPNNSEAYELKWICNQVRYYFPDLIPSDAMIVAKYLFYNEPELFNREKTKDYIPNQYQFKHGQYYQQENKLITHIIAEIIKNYDQLENYKIPRGYEYLKDEVSNMIQEMLTIEFEEGTGVKGDQFNTIELIDLINRYFPNLKYDKENVKDCIEILIALRYSVLMDAESMAPDDRDIDKIISYIETGNKNSYTVIRTHEGVRLLDDDHEYTTREEDEEKMIANSIEYSMKLIDERIKRINWNKFHEYQIFKKIQYIIASQFRLNSKNLEEVTHLIINKYYPIIFKQKYKQKTKQQFQQQF